MFFGGDNKEKLVPASFSYVIREKWILAKKCVVVITVIISLHHKETS